jgi:hypothetical protein
MPIPTSRAYRTSYWLWVISLAGSQTNGYILAAIASVPTAHAQPICTIRQISQAMKLMGSRSTRAAISPGMTRVFPPAAVPVPEVSFAIAVLLAAAQGHGVAGKAGEDGAFADTVDGDVGFAADAEGAGQLLLNNCSEEIRRNAHRSRPGNGHLVVRSECRSRR